MPFKLTIQKLDEVAFVDKGGAVGANVLITKRNAGTPGDNPEARMPLSKKQQEQIDAFAKDWFDGFKKAKDSGEAAGLPLGDPEKLLEQALSAVKDESTKAAIMAAVAALFRATPPPAKAAEPPKPPKAEPVPEEPVEMAANCAPGADKIPPVAKRDDVLKGATPEIRALFEDMNKRLESATQRIDASEKVAKAEIAKRELAEEVEVAKAFLHVPGDIAKRASLLFVVRKSCGAEAYADLVQAFKASEELLAKHLDKPAKGSSREDTSGAPADDDKASAYAKVQAGVKELVEKSGGRMSKAQALRKFAQENPEAYAAAR